MPPQKLKNVIQFSDSICMGTRRYSNTPRRAVISSKFLVRHSVSPSHKFRILTSIGCASPKMSLLALVRGSFSPKRKKNIVGLALCLIKNVSD